MRTVNINTGIFLGYYNNILDKKENKLLVDSLSHLNNETLTISLFTTVSKNYYYSRILPLSLIDNNYSFDIKK